MKYDITYLNIEKAFRFLKELATATEVDSDWVINKAQEILDDTTDVEGN